MINHSESHSGCRQSHQTSFSILLLDLSSWYTPSKFYKAKLKRKKEREVGGWQGKKDKKVKLLINNFQENVNSCSSTNKNVSQAEAHSSICCIFLRTPTRSGGERSLPLPGGPLASAVARLWHGAQARLDAVLHRITPCAQILKTQLSHAKPCPSSRVSALRVPEVRSGGPTAQPCRCLVQSGFLRSGSCCHIWSPRVCMVEHFTAWAWGAAGSIPQAGEWVRVAEGYGQGARSQEREDGMSHMHEQDGTTQRMRQTVSVPRILQYLSCTPLLQRSVASWTLGVRGQNQNRKIGIRTHSPWLKMVICFLFIFTITVSQWGCPRAVALPLLLHSITYCWIPPASYTSRITPAQPSVPSDLVRRQISCSLMGECWIFHYHLSPEVWRLIICTI